MTRVEKLSFTYDLDWQYVYEQHTRMIQTIAVNTRAAITASYPSVIGEGRLTGFVHEFGIYSEIVSLPEVPFADIKDDDSNTVRNTKALEMEWGTPSKFLFNIWTTGLPNPRNDPSLGDWKLRGKLSLLNPMGRPYSFHNPFNMLTLNDNIARMLGEGRRLGVSLEDGGSGYPVTGRDIITVDFTWTQELQLFLPSKEPVIIYIQQGTTGTPTPTTPPAVTLTRATGFTGSVFITDEESLTFAISQLTAARDFFIQWVKAGSVVNTLTFQTAGTATTFNYVFNSRQFLPAPYSGAGSYTLRVNQNGVSSETAAITVLAPTCDIRSDSTTTYNASDSVWYVELKNIKQGTTVQVRWLKLVNGVYTPVTAGYTNVTIGNSTNHLYSGSGSLWNGAAYGVPNTYKLELVRGGVTIQSANTLFATTPPTSGSGGLG